MQTGRVVKTCTSKKGHEVVIRYPQQEDLDALLSYVNALSSEDTFVEIHNETVTKEQEIEYLTRVLSDIETKETIQLLAFVDGVLAGNCVVSRGKYRKTHVGTVGISVSKSFREEGIGTVLLETLIEEAKTLQGLKLLTLTYYENNPRALHIYEKFGFRNVGVVPGAIAFHGDFVGEVMMYKTL